MPKDLTEMPRDLRRKSFLCCGVLFERDHGVYRGTVGYCSIQLTVPHSDGRFRVSVGTGLWLYKPAHLRCGVRRAIALLRLVALGNVDAARVRHAQATQAIEYAERHLREVTEALALARKPAPTKTKTRTKPKAPRKARA